MPLHPKLRQEEKKTEMGTYRRKILDIDLTTGDIETTALDEEVLRKFIGGSGLAAKLFLDRVSPDVDPLSDGNVLFVMTGPLAGTTLPSVSRFEACFKSPLTGIWGESSCGGNFAPELKAAGYDGIAIRGSSPKPVYILIEDEKVEIRDASDLWGKDSYETTDLLKRRLGGKREVKVLAIGQAGEKVVKYASIVNDKANVAGRSGSGAVMGSKKLKAIAVRGSGKLVPALPDEYAEVRRACLDKIKNSPVTQFMREYGTNGSMAVSAAVGELPIKNWTQGEAPDIIPKIDANALTTNYLTKRHACQGCLIATKRVVKVDTSPYQMTEGPGPEFESVGAFGSLLLNDNLAAICKLNEMCNRYGMDTISCGSTIGLAMECFEKGLISSNDLDGGQLRWGNPDDVIAMVEKIAHRQGFGDVLAEGSRRAGEKIGKGAADFAMEVKGLEMPMRDPRAYHGLGIAYAMSNRGGCHVEHMVTYLEVGGYVAPELGLPGGYLGQTSQGKAEITVIGENVGALTNAAILCQFAMISLGINDFLGMLRTTTGFDYNLEELMRCGERIWVLKRGLNNLMGVTVADDRLPKRILTPLKEGAAAGSVPDMELMLKEYYSIRGLDAKGRPLKDKLISLGLSDLATRL